MSSAPADRSHQVAHFILGVAEDAFVYLHGSGTVPSQRCIDPTGQVADVVRREDLLAHCPDDPLLGDIAASPIAGSRIPLIDADSIEFRLVQTPPLLPQLSLGSGG